MIVDDLDDAPSKTGEIAQRIVDQVLREAGRREHARGSHVSVMPISVPGVVKTAIAEGLERRIEFEPERVLVRLRDCRVVNPINLRIAEASPPRSEV